MGILQSLLTCRLQMVVLSPFTNDRSLHVAHEVKLAPDVTFRRLYLNVISTKPNTKLSLHLLVPRLH